MIHDWISIPILFIITIGFARLLGCIIREILATQSIGLILLSLPIFLLILASPLTLTTALQWLLFTLSISVTLIYAFFPEILPTFAQSRRFDLRYVSFAMLLSAIWFLSEGLMLWSNGPIMAGLMSAVGLITGLLSWQKSFTF